MLLDLIRAGLEPMLLTQPSFRHGAIPPTPLFQRGVGRIYCRNDGGTLNSTALPAGGRTLIVRLKYLKGTQSDKHKEAIVEAVQAKAGGDAADIKRWLNRYIARNQSDFFIHKRLKDALGEDLDIFVKTEVLNADQLLTEGDLPQRLIKVARLVRQIGLAIIDFLAALEDFQ